MTKKIFYLEFSEPFWIDVTVRLQQEYGWQPVYWTGKRDIEDAVRKNFPGVIHQHNVDAVKMVFPPQFAEREMPPLDRTMLDGMADCQIATLKMMDRMEALDSFRYNERVRHFYRILRYWMMVLDDLQPDIVFFKEIPHMVYDYVLYELCKLRGIQTLMLMITNLRRLWFLMDSIYDENIVMKRYKELIANPPEGKVQLSPESDQYLKSFQSTAYDEVPRFVRFVKREELSDPNAKHWLLKLFDIQNYPQYAKKQIGLLQTRFKPPRNYLKVMGKKAEESSMSLLGYRWFNFKAKRKIDGLANYYSQLTREVDFSKPYIYVALTYQPESNSSPKGGVFAHSELMVQMISRCVPEGWTVYVKEHPSQLSHDRANRSQAARWTYYYDDLASMPNVRLVPMSTSPYDLIDNARAVATLTGTTGFQAVNRGRPALIFGYPFYRGCEGVFHIQTVEDCKLAIQEVLSGYRVDPEKVRLFIYALEQMAIVEYVEGKWRYFFQSSNDPEAMANEIHRYWDILRA